MESPVLVFLKWLESQKNNPFTTDLCFQFLVLCPNYGISKLSELEYGQNYFEHVHNLLTSIEDKKQIVGMSLSVESIVSFIVDDWGDINKTLDSNIFDPAKASTDDERRLLENARKNQFRNIEPRKEIKQSWDELKKQTYNFEYFDKYLIEEDLLGGDR